MINAGPSVESIMASLEKARHACEERQVREGVSPELTARRTAATDLLRSVPRFVRMAPAQALQDRVRDLRLLEAARSWSWSCGNLILMGPTGLGKSTAAALLVRRLVARATRVGGDEWDSVQTIHWAAATALELARRQHPLGQGDAPEIIRAMRARLLVIDDAGWDRDPVAVSHVLDVRMQEELQTIVTTGLTRTDLSGHYGAAIIRRLIDAGGRTPILVDAFPASEGTR